MINLTKHESILWYPLRILGWSLNILDINNVKPCKENLWIVLLLNDYVDFKYIVLFKLNTCILGGIYVPISGGSFVYKIYLPFACFILITFYLWFLSHAEILEFV